MTDKQPTAADEISGYQKAMRQTGSGTASVQAAQLARWHAAIERKDALLRQCLKHVASNITRDGCEAEELYDAITRELSA